jgi:hypothetical protein
MQGKTYSDVIGPMVNPPPGAKWQGVPEKEILATFGKLLAVLRYTRIICSCEAATIQQVMHSISNERETVDVEFVRFDSAVFAEEQDEPTEQAVLEHFEKHKKFFAGSVSKENPRGFGYKTEDRVQLEYIAVKLEDISKIVKVPTQEDAEEYYLRNRWQYTVPVKPDPNKPDAPTERVRSYGEVAGTILNMLQQKRIEAKAVQILQEAEILTQASPENADTEAAEPTVEELKANAGDYGTAAEQLRAKYKVTVYAGQTGLLSAVEMQTDRYLGRLFVRGQGDSVVGLIQLAFAIDEFNASELSPFDAAKPKMFENIGPARDMKGRMTSDLAGQIMVVLRVIEAEKAHEPESIDSTYFISTLDVGEPVEAEEFYSVRDKVVEDLKKLAAMAETRARAEEFIKEVADANWTDAVDEFNELYGPAEEDANDSNAVTPEESTDDDKPFRLQSLTNLPRRSSVSLDALAIRSESFPTGRFNVDVAKKDAAMLDRIYSLVPQDSNTVANLPVIVEFEPDMSFYVIKDLSVKRVFSNEYQVLKALQVYREELVQSQSMAAVHYNPENIVERMNFKPVERDKQPADANAPAPAEGAS